MRENAEALSKQIFNLAESVKKAGPIGKFFAAAPVLGLALGLRAEKVVGKLDDKEYADLTEQLNKITA